MKNVEVTQMTSQRTGEAVRNQFIIRTNKGRYFQSYRSIIAFIPRNGGKIQLDKHYWDYSVTTSRYRNDFLRETTKETQRKIDNGTYLLKDLNN